MKNAPLFFTIHKICIKNNLLEVFNVSEMFGDDIVYGPIGFVVFSSKMNQQPSQVVCCYIHGSYQNFHHFHPPQHLLCFFHTNAHTQLLKVCFFWKVQCNCTSNCFGLLQKLHCLPSCLALPFFLSIVLH